MSPRIALAALAALLAFAVLAPGGGAEPRSAAVKLDLVGHFENPVHVAAPPGDSDRVFVVERPGRVRVVHAGKVVDKPFLDIRPQVRCCGEQGLLSIAFAPDYATSGRFYVDYTSRPRGDIRVVEYRVSKDADVADAGSARTVLRVSHSRHPNHNGGQLAFGPDGRLYVSVGDGGGAGDPSRNGQNRRSLLGKILRIDASRRGAKPVMYAYGLRNPFRFSFDRSTGDLSIGDVGQDKIEEVDFLPRGTKAGTNFGWSVFEGTSRFRSGTVRHHRKPVIQHSHAQGWCAIIGGFVVRDRSSDLYGRYVYSDNCKGELYSARLSSRGARGDGRVGLSVPGISSFGEDADGHVYAAALGGSVYRLR